MLESMNITHDGLVYMATATAADKLNMIDARIAKLGRRRDELIDKYETRRRMLATMQNSLVEKRPHADVIDVTPARDLHGVPSTD